MNAEKEVSGLLQKKSSKGIYQQRYFKTTGNKLEYWKDQTDHDQRKPSTSFDMNDIKVAKSLIITLLSLISLTEH